MSSITRAGPHQQSQLSRTGGWTLSTHSINGVPSQPRELNQKTQINHGWVQNQMKSQTKSPRGNVSPRCNLGGGALTWSKQQHQGQHVAYAADVSAPIQCNEIVKAKHLVEARHFGQGITETGPGRIPHEIMTALGQLDAIVRQAEIVVNRLARDVRDAEEKNVTGKLRPRLLRAASLSEKTVMQAQQQINAQIRLNNLGQTKRINNEGETEIDIVQLFTVRLETAARKIYTLGFETPGSELARADQIKANAGISVYSPPSGKNLRNGQFGSYGRYASPPIIKPATTLSSNFFQ